MLAEKGPEVSVYTLCLNAVSYDRTGIAVGNVKRRDDDATETASLACLERSLEVLSCLPTGEPNEASVAVKGPAESVDAFVEDVANGER